MITERPFRSGTYAFLESKSWTLLAAILFEDTRKNIKGYGRSMMIAKSDLLDIS
jgi:hypothetical protein